MGQVKVPGMRAPAVGGVKVIWAGSQVLSFQASWPILNNACVSPIPLLQGGKESGFQLTLRKAGHTFPNDRES